MVQSYSFSLMATSKGAGKLEDFKTEDLGMIASIFFYNSLHLLFAVNTTPLLKDLYKYITPEYASRWRVLGTSLSLPTGELNAIEAGYPTNIKWCCDKMLEKWLEVDPTASWRKMFTVIESPAISSAPMQEFDIGK